MATQPTGCDGQIVSFHFHQTRRQCRAAAAYSGNASRRCILSRRKKDWAGQLERAVGGGQSGGQWVVASLVGRAVGPWGCLRAVCNQSLRCDRPVVQCCSSVWGARSGLAPTRPYSLLPS